MYTAVQGVSWSKGKKTHVRYSYYQSGCSGLENNAQDETVACSEKAAKKMTQFPFLHGKMDAVSCFEIIFPSKTLWKLNKIDTVGFIVLFSFVSGHHCLCLFHGNGRVIYLYSPYTITSLSWPNNRGNIRSSLFLPLMIRSFQPQSFRCFMHIHM